MAMASSQSTNNNNNNSSSKKNIPGTMTFNLRTSSTEAAPLVRRPMIACESCRAAKVKCNGQQPCERCKTRNNTCVHNSSSSRRSSLKAKQTASSATASKTATGLMTPVEHTPMLLDDPSLNHSTVASDLQDPNHMLWPNEGLVTWFNTEPITMPRLISNGETTGCSDIFNAFTETTPLPSPYPGPLSPTTVSDLLPVDLEMSPTHRLSSSDECPCRVTLISYVPKLEMIISQGSTLTLDKALKITEDVVQKCKLTLHCPVCQVRPADLVCIANVFQQTAACFQHISKAGLYDTSMKMGLGDYELSSCNDIRFKRMLVLNLVKEASAFLDSLDKLGQSLFMSPTSQRLGRSPVCLDQVNLAYVREVVLAFKKFFKSINDGLDLTLTIES